MAAARGAQAATGGKVAIGPESKVAGEEVEVDKVDAVPPGVTNAGDTGRWAPFDWRTGRADSGKPQILPASCIVVGPVMLGMASCFTDASTANACRGWIRH